MKELWLYTDSGKEHGDCYSYWGYIGVIWGLYIRSPSGPLSSGSLSEVLTEPCHRRVPSFHMMYVYIASICFQAA